MPKHIATWNPARDAWETNGGGLFCEHLGVYSETWPTSGMTRGGAAYELPTLAPLTAETESSSTHGLSTPRATHGGSSTETVVLLKTPTSNLGMNGGAQHPDKRRQGGHGPTLADEVMHLLPTPMTTDSGSASIADTQRNPPGLRVIGHLLPTPRATDGTKGVPNQRGSSGDLMLPSAAHHLLPTPTAADSTASGGSAPSDVTLTDAAVRTDMGRAANPRHGAHTHQPSPAGNPSWGVQRQRRQSQHREAGDD